MNRCPIGTHKVGNRCVNNTEDFSKDNPSESEEWQLVDKSYKTEVYQKSISKCLMAIVSMHYHTTDHYWTAQYYMSYGDKFQYGTKNIIIKDFEGETARKEARKSAERWMKESAPDDFKKLDKFYQDLIIESCRNDFGMQNPY